MKIFFSCIESKDPYRVYLVYFQYWVRTIILLQGKQRSIDHVQHASIEAITCVKYPKLHEKNIIFIVSMCISLIKTGGLTKVKLNAVLLFQKWNRRSLNFENRIYSRIFYCAIVTELINACVDDLKGKTCLKAEHFRINFRTFPIIAQWEKF